MRIIELSDDYVKFYHYDDPGKVEIIMNRSLIREIRYEYGRKEVEVQPGLDESYFVDDKRNNIKLNFSGIADNATIITYEKAIDPFSAWEIGIKAHGVGVEGYDGENTDKSGFGIEGGYKIKFGHIFKKNDYRPNHLLQGTYLRPEAGFSFVKIEDNRPDRNREYNYIHAGIDIGHEWILQNKISLDIFTGLHFYGGKNDDDYYADCEQCDDDFFISDGNISGSYNVAGRYGLQVGFLF